MTDSDKRQSTHKDYEKRILDLLAQEIITRLEDPELAADMPASVMEVARKISSDAGITLSSIRRGEWGETAKELAENVIQLPERFDEDGFPEVGGTTNG